MDQIPEERVPEDRGSLELPRLDAQSNIHHIKGNSVCCTCVSLNSKAASFLLKDRSLSSGSGQEDHTEPQFQNQGS